MDLEGDCVAAPRLIRESGKDAMEGTRAGGESHLATDVDGSRGWDWLSLAEAQGAVPLR